MDFILTRRDFTKDAARSRIRCHTDEPDDPAPAETKRTRHN